MDQRALMYANLLNGVPEWKVAETFHVTPEDVRATFRFIGTKIASYVFERRRPPIFCDTISQAQKHRLQILTLLPKLKLDKAPAFSKIIHETVNHENAPEAFGTLNR